MSNSPHFIIEQRGPDYFAVLGPNPDFGKADVSYAGEHLTVCTMGGRGEAKLVAAALNAFAPARGWPDIESALAAAQGEA